MFLLFFLAWIIFNGKITLEILFLGLLISGAVFWFMCRFMDYSLKKENAFYDLLLAFPKYLLILIREIVKANVTVFKLILTNKELIEPAIVTFRTDLKSDVLKVILANSITLTPGTITVSLDHDVYTVHCLDKSLAEGMEDSVFVEMLRDLERTGEK